MGKYVVRIEGVGCNHNDKPYDIEQLAKLFLAELKADGHQIGVATITFEGSAGELNLLLKESHGAESTMAESFGLIDGMFKGLLSQISIDGKKFIKHPKFKEGLHCFALAAKDAVTAPLNVDDVLIDQLELILGGILDQQPNTGPVEVGAAPRLPRKKHTLKQVEDAIRAEGGDPTKFNPMILVALAYLPSLIEMIRKLLGK